MSSPVTAGVAGSLTVTTDPSYTGTIVFSSSDAQAGLPASFTFTAADAGVHTFNVTFKTAGTESVTATDTATGTVTGSEAGISVSPAAASTLVVSGFPAADTAGAAGTVTVTAKDAYGNTATGYTGTVALSSSDAQAGLPASYTFAAADAGVHSFSTTLKTAGMQSLTATDTATSTVTGSEAGISVSPAAASTFVVSGFPASDTAGTAASVTVTVKDAYGNTAAGYTGTVRLTSSDAQAGLPASYTFAAADAGVHTFSATLKTAGSQSLTATDTATGTVTGSEAGISVSPAAASTLVVSGFPAADTAGAAASVTVTAKDAYGNTATGYTGTVRLSSSDALAGLPASYAFAAADAGAHTFSATLKTAGSQSLTATDTATSTITGTEVGITVGSAVASILVVSGFPSSDTAGAAASVTVTAKDAYGNTAAGYTGSVRLTSSDAQAGLPASYTFAAADAGVHTFSATLKTAGTQSVTATDTATGTVTGTEAGITVGSAAASTLVVSGFPTSDTAGAAGTVTVTAEDVYGNTAAGYTGTVRLSSTDAQAGLPASYTFTAADAGAHTFSATLKTAGTQSLTATDTATSTLTGTEAGITVSPAAASTFVVSGFPSPVSAGETWNVTVTAEDAYDNTATGYTGTVVFTSSDALAGLPASYTFAAADQGAQTFSATLNTAGTQSLTVTDSLNPAVTGSQAGITVRPAWAHPELITISFVPDGTLMTSGTGGNVYSNLFAKFNAKWSTATWEDAIIAAAQTWARYANINFSIVNDNGTASGQGAYQQGDPGMGDIRVGSYAMTSNVLGLGYFAPPTNNYSVAGDFDFNSTQNYNLGSTYDLQSVAMHEIGHALGLGESTTYGAVMYPSYTGVKRALTSDDISRIQAIYGARTGDAYDGAGVVTPNNSFQNAADISSQIVPGALTAQLSGLDLTTPSQAEFFKFTAPAASGSTLTVNVQSAGLSLLRPTVTVYAADQATVLGTATAANSYNGGNLTVSTTGPPLLGLNLLGLRVSLGSAGVAGQTFYVKVTGADTTTFGTGAYALTLNMGTGALPAVTPPNTQVLNGAVIVAGGGAAQVVRGEPNDYLTTDGSDVPLPPPPPRPGTPPSAINGGAAGSGQDSQGGAVIAPEGASRLANLRDSGTPASGSPAPAQGGATLNSSLAPLGQAATVLGPGAFAGGATQNGNSQVATQLALALAPPSGSAQAGSVRATSVTPQNVPVAPSAQQSGQAGARQVAPMPSSGESDTPRLDPVSTEGSEPELREENESAPSPAAPIPGDVEVRQQATDAVFANPALAAFSRWDEDDHAALADVFADPMLLTEAATGDTPAVTLAEPAEGNPGSAALAVFALFGAGWWSAISRPADPRTQEKKGRTAE